MESHLFGENLLLRRILGNPTKISILISLPHLANHTPSDVDILLVMGEGRK